jgi:hypothetical protein
MPRPGLSDILSTSFSDRGSECSDRIRFLFPTKAPLRHCSKLLSRNIKVETRFAQNPPVICVPSAIFLCRSSLASSYHHQHLQISKKLSYD